VLETDALSALSRRQTACRRHQHDGRRTDRPSSRTTPRHRRAGAEARARAPAAFPTSIWLHAGEVLGLGGLVGSGRTEIARAVRHRPAGRRRNSDRRRSCAFCIGARRHGCASPMSRKTAWARAW
jgi:ABC-type sugar transport system ATPase subunit